MKSNRKYKVNLAKTAPVSPGHSHCTREGVPWSHWLPSRTYTSFKRSPWGDRPDLQQSEEDCCSTFYRHGSLFAKLRHYTPLYTSIFNGFNIINISPILEHSCMTLWGPAHPQRMVEMVEVRYHVDNSSWPTKIYQSGSLPPFDRDQWENKELMIEIRVMPSSGV